MDVEIRYSPAFSLAIVRPGVGEALRADPCSVMSRSSGVHVRSSEDTVLDSVKRGVLGTGPVPTTVWLAERDGAEITFAPALPGDIIHWVLQDHTLFLRSGAFLAASTALMVESDWTGSAVPLSRLQRSHLLRVSGRGDLLVASYGSVHSVDLHAEDSYTVSSGHVIGWSDSVVYRISSGVSGDEDQIELTGPGRLYLQTRSALTLARTLASRRA